MPIATEHIFGRFVLWLDVRDIFFKKNNNLILIPQVTAPALRRECSVQF